MSKDGHVALASHDALKVPVHFYPEFVAVTGKYCFQIRSLSGNPGEEVSDLLSLAMPGRGHEYQLRPVPINQAAVEALQVISDLVLPPAAFHRGANYLRKVQKQALHSSRRRSSGLGENRACQICVNTRDLRESFVAQPGRCSCRNTNSSNLLGVLPVEALQRASCTLNCSRFSHGCGSWLISRTNASIKAIGGLRSKLRPSFAKGSEQHS